MIIISLFFFAIFGMTSGFVEHTMREDNLSNGIKAPIDHGELVQRRVVAGGAWLVAVALFYILFGQFSWALILYIPMSMGVFGVFHRLTINYAASRGPWYLGVDSKIDQMALKAVGVKYIYPSSAEHYEAWEYSDGYAKMVKKAAILLYMIEFAITTTSAYIIL